MKTIDQVYPIPTGNYSFTIRSWDGGGVFLSGRAKRKPEIVVCGDDWLWEVREPAW